jgi:hypothetical protein
VPDAALGYIHYNPRGGRLMLLPIGLLLLVTSLVIPSTTLVLRSGQRIVVEGPIQERNGQILFRQPGGLLFSIPLPEVDLDATRAAASGSIIVPIREPEEPSKKRKRTLDDLKLSLKVDEEERKRLIHDLEANHSGTPAPSRSTVDVSAMQGPSPSAGADPEEWSWRHRAREYEEAIRRARENLALLENRIQRLRSEIRTMLVLGYKPSQFSYQTTELQFAADSLDAARLEVTRAERAYAQFRDDARRQGILPGWLR